MSQESSIPEILEDGGLTPSIPLSDNKSDTYTRSNLTRSGFGSKTNLAVSKNGSRSNLFGSKSNLLVKQPLTNVVVFENTYRLKPDIKFGSVATTRIIQEVLERKIGKTKYEQDKLSDLTCSISNEILAEIKKLGYERYKIVVQVDIGELKGQGIKVASRCVWDSTTDSWASGTYKNVPQYLSGDDVCSGDGIWLLS